MGIHPEKLKTNENKDIKYAFSHFAIVKVSCQLHSYFELLQRLSEATLKNMDKYITRILYQLWYCHSNPRPKNMDILWVIEHKYRKMIFLWYMIPITFNISVLGHNIPNFGSFVYIRPVWKEAPSHRNDSDNSSLMSLYNFSSSTTHRLFNRELVTMEFVVNSVYTLVWILRALTCPIPQSLIPRFPFWVNIISLSSGWIIYFSGYYETGDFLNEPLYCAAFVHGALCGCFKWCVAGRLLSSLSKEACGS